jgi:hypothetical protein
MLARRCGTISLGKLQPINFANFATARDAIICARTDLTYTTTDDYKNRTKDIETAKVSRCGRNLLKANYAKSAALIKDCKSFYY